MSPRVFSGMHWALFAAVVAGIWSVRTTGQAQAVEQGKPTWGIRSTLDLPKLAGSGPLDYAVTRLTVIQHRKGHCFVVVEKERFEYNGTDDAVSNAVAIVPAHWEVCHP